MGMEMLTEIFLFPLKDSRTTGHEITLVKDQCRLDITKFAQRKINEWNKFSADCVTSGSMNMFKNKIV